jgi:hypothetical protein
MITRFSLLFLAVTVVLLFMSTYIFSQQQISNSGFEFWEEIRSDVSEPVKWNSIKNTDGGMSTNRLAPDVISRSEIAHSGKYSIMMVNKSALGIVANGIVTNGAIHGSTDKDKSYMYTDAKKTEFSTPFISRPDSLTGWYMYTPQGKDSAMVILLLHKGYITLPDHGTKGNWVGGVKLLLPATKKNKWTRFSVPVQYFQKGYPQYVIVILSAGNRKQAVKGSVAYFDDLKLIYNKGK